MLPACSLQYDVITPDKHNRTKLTQTKLYCQQPGNKGRSFSMHDPQIEFMALIILGPVACTSEIYEVNTGNIPIVRASK